jgi:hypothetical protein
MGIHRNRLDDYGMAIKREANANILPVSTILVSEVRSEVCHNAQDAEGEQNVACSHRLDVK